MYIYKIYVSTCPHCKEDISIKIKNNKVISITHIDKKINTSELTNFPIEFG